MEQALAEIGRLAEVGFDAVVVKAIYGSSGRGQIHCRGGQVRAEQRGRLENILRQQGQVVVEPWLDKVVDLSLHFDVGVEGAMRRWPAGRDFSLMDAASIAARSLVRLPLASTRK